MGESVTIQKVSEISDAVDLDASNLTPIQEFYKDANVFVTGATGLLGQVLVEKLLRSCPVSKIYILIRDKKGKDVDTRLNELFDDVLYKRLRKTNPNFLQQIVAVVGDCSLPNLGITDQDIKMLIDDVNIVFHVAATVRFDEKLNKAAAINIRGTRDLSKMVQQMPKLKSFVHVSTAFSNCNEEVIEEKVYPTTMNYNDLLQITETLDDFVLDKLTPHFTGKCPNTYVYTKQIAEDIIKQETKGLASSIFRPSIVVSTYKEPVRAYISNFNGAVGVLYGAAMGVLRVMNLTGTMNANIVPLDMCVYGLIASAWDVAERLEKSKREDEEFEVPVYNYENSNDNPITWYTFRNTTVKYGRPLPSMNMLWYGFLWYIKYYYLYQIFKFFLHVIPATIIDSILIYKGKKPRMFGVYKRVHNFTESVAYFCVRTFKFESYNIRKMVHHMSERDRDIFFCDLKELDWEEFCSNCWAGCRMYLAKEPIDTLPQAKKKMGRFLLATKAIAVVLGLSFTVILWFILSAIFRLLKW